jgi:hypothetical protein
MQPPASMPAAAAAARAVSSVLENGELYTRTELGCTPNWDSCCRSSCLHRGWIRSSVSSRGRTGTSW